MKKFVIILIFLPLIIACKKGNRSGIYLLRSCNRVAQFSKNSDTSDFTSGVKLLSVKRLPDTLNALYYQAVVLIPSNSVEMQAITVYQLPKLMSSTDRKDFCAKVLLVSDTLSAKPVSLKAYRFKFEPSKSEYVVNAIESIDQP